MIKKGNFWEKVSAIYLFLKGYKIKKFNYRTRWGEIDLICEKNQTLVFVEVKYRKSDRFGRAEEFVDKRKREKIVKTANCYLASEGVDKKVRFDVIAVNGFKINHIKNAFEGDWL